DSFSPLSPQKRHLQAVAIILTATSEHALAVWAVWTILLPYTWAQSAEAPSTHHRESPKRAMHARRLEAVGSRGGVGRVPAPPVSPSPAPPPGHPRKCPATLPWFAAFFRPL